MRSDDEHLVDMVAEKLQPRFDEWFEQFEEDFASKLGEEFDRMLEDRLRVLLSGYLKEE